MPRPRKLTEQMRAEIMEVARKRKELRNLPTTKELARRAGCSPRTVQDAMYGRSNACDSEDSRGTRLSDEGVECVLQGTFDAEGEASD
jgi:predicted kinase